LGEFAKTRPGMKILLILTSKLLITNSTIISTNAIIAKNQKKIAEYQEKVNKTMNYLFLEGFLTSSEEQTDSEEYEE
jgi:hypothetical protein